MTDDSINTGVPRSNATTYMPTPKNSIIKLLQPIQLEHVFTILLLITSTGIIFNHYFSILEYNISIFVFHILISIFCIGLVSISKNTVIRENSIPSIRDVSLEVKFAEVSRNISIITISGIIISKIFLIIANESELFFSFGPATRSSFVTFIGVSAFASYIIVKLILSFKPTIDSSSIFIKIVNKSSVFELLFISGFLIAYSIVIFTGLLYDGTALIHVDYFFSLADALISLLTILILYITAIYRI